MKAPKGFKFITDPYEFQYPAFVYGIEHPQAGILYDLGLGKTKIAIDIMRYRIFKNEVDRVLVCCPTSIMEKWREEVERHSEHKAIVLYGNRNERLARLKIRGPAYKFFIINYEALRLFHKELAILKCNGMVLDESARYLKNREAQRTIACKGLSQLAPYRLLLTATPIANRPKDLWSQFEILDGGDAFGAGDIGYGLYMGTYFDRRLLKMGKRRFYDYKFRPEMTELIHEKIFEKCIRKTKYEALGEDLPEQTFKEIPIPMSGLTLSTYETVEEQVLANILTEEGVAQLNITNILTKLLRLQQVTSGFTNDDITGEVQILSETPKLDALMEEIESIVDAEESVVVWCRFLKSIDMIKDRCTKAGIRCLTMSGKDKDKHSKWSSFQKAKGVPVFVAQIESGGIGIELFKINTQDEYQHMIFYENTWSLDVRQQAIGRIHRIGQKAHCNYIDLIMEDSIDLRILKSLKANKRIADAILNEGVEGWLTE